MKSLSITLCLLVTSILFAQQTPKTEETKPAEKTNELKEVTIYGNKKQYLKIDSDKTTISVRDNAMLNSGSSLEAVKKNPRCDYLSSRNHYLKQQRRDHIY